MKKGARLDERTLVPVGAVWTLIGVVVLVAMWIFAVKARGDANAEAIIDLKAADKARAEELQNIHYDLIRIEQILKQHFSHEQR